MATHQGRDTSQGNDLEITIMTNNSHVNDFSDKVTPPGEIAVTQPSHRPHVSDDLHGHRSMPHDMHSTTIMSVVDILSDGSAIDYNTPNSSAHQYGFSAVNSPLKSRSIRVIFKCTHDVFADGSQEPVNGSLPDDKESANLDQRRPMSDVSKHADSEPTSTPSPIVQSDFPSVGQNRYRDSAQSAIDAPQEIRSTKSNNDFDKHETFPEISGRTTPFEYTMSSTTFDQASGELSRHNYKRWNWYRGGFGIDSISVFRLLECESSAKLRVGVNMMFDTEDRDGANNDKIWSSRFKQGKNDLTLNGTMHTFYTVPNVVQYSRQPSCNSLKVELVFQSTFQAEAPMNAKYMHSPLRNRLGTMLCSGESAVSLFKGDVDMGIRLLTFDILSATVACWIDFLKLVRLKSAWQSYSFKDLESIEKYRPLLDDRANVADFARSTRDLLQAVETTITMIDADKNFDEEQRSKFRHILLYRQLQREVLQSKMQDIKDNMEDMAAHMEVLTEEKRTDSLKRLTIVASIFLPLTTACSLLSMSNRVNNIGAIWWDWFGIVAIIGFLVVIGYRIVEARDNVLHESDMQVQMRTWNREWSKAKVHVLKLEERQHPSHNPRVSTDELWYQRIPLTPGFNRIVFQLSKYLFFMGVVASFLVGMFVNVSIGVKSLGYSAAGTVLVVIGSILIWRFLNGVKQILFRTSRSFESSLNAQVHESRQNTQDRGIPSKQHTVVNQSILNKVLHLWAMAASHISRRGSTNPATMNTSVKPLARIYRWLVVILLRPIWKLNYWILSVFFGELVFKVMLKTLINILEYKDLDHIPDLEEYFKIRFGKREDEDLEASALHNDSPSLSGSSSNSDGMSEHQRETHSTDQSGVTNSGDGTQKYNRSGDKYEKGEPGEERSK